jgi:hypothetical protein
VITAVPDGANCVNDIARSEPARACCLRLACLATAELDALRKDGGTSRTMDRSRRPVRERLHPKGRRANAPDQTQYSTDPDAAPRCDRQARAAQLTGAVSGRRIRQPAVISARVIEPGPNTSTPLRVSNQVASRSEPLPRRPPWPEGKRAADLGMDRLAKPENCRALPGAGSCGGDFGRADLPTRPYRLPPRTASRTSGRPCHPFLLSSAAETLAHQTHVRHE